MLNAEVLFPWLHQSILGWEHFDQAEVKELLLVRHIGSPASWYSLSMQTATKHTLSFLTLFQRVSQGRLSFVKDRLEETSYEVDKLLASYNCRHLFVSFLYWKEEQWLVGSAQSVQLLVTQRRLSNTLIITYTIKHQISVSLESDLSWKNEILIKTLLNMYLDLDSEQNSPDHISVSPGTLFWAKPNQTWFLLRDEENKLSKFLTCVTTLYS